MVSMLSSRLMKDLPSLNNPKAGNKKPRISVPSTGSSTFKRVSGYSADREGMRGTSPLGDIPEDKQKRANQVESLAKKRRVAEINYDVANARADIAKAGLTCPGGLVGRSRALPPGSVHMGSVTLMLSNQYDQQDIHPDKSFENFISSPYIGSVYSELLNSTRLHYKSRRRGRVPQEAIQNSEGSIDTPLSSSLSDTESDDVNEITIPARVDETSTKHGASSNNRLKNKHVLRQKNPHQSSITFEKALSYSPFARLIIQADPPFNIVFTNAAYSRLTSVDSHLIVGHPLSRSGLNDIDPVKLYESPTSCVNHETWIITPQNDGVSKTKPNQQAKLKIFMILRAIYKDNKSLSLGNKITEPGVRTHFCLELSKSQFQFTPEQEPTNNDETTEKENDCMKMMG